MSVKKAMLANIPQFVLAEKDIYSLYRIMRHLLNRGDCTYKSLLNNAAIHYQS